MATYSQEGFAVPVFKQQLIIDITRGIRAFLNLEAGIVRNVTRPSGPGAKASRASTNSRRRRRKDQAHISLQTEHLQEEQRERLVTPGRELADARSLLSENGGETGAGGPNPANIVWIFGDGRSGTTWLASMMGNLKGHTLWREPNVGTLFGSHYYVWANDKQREGDHFILGARKDSWLNSIRNFVLAEARTRFPDLSRDEYLVVKEPFGSVGAPLLMQALPESRMIFLVRDPRDVVASALDAHKKGSWSYWRTKAAKQGEESLAGTNPDAFVKHRAERYLLNVGNSNEAYEAHRGPKVMIRYEELRAEPLVVMKHLLSTLGMPVEETELARVVKKHAWENIPEEKKGEGKFHRKATPGGWKEDLTPEQAETIERITAPLLEQFYPG